MVLYWSWLRERLQAAACPPGAAAWLSSLTVNCARPSGVAKVRSSRGPCGSTKPPGASIFALKSSKPGNHPADRVADGRVIAREARPSRRAVDSGALSARPYSASAIAADDLDLAQQVVGRRLAARRARRARRPSSPRR